MLPLSDQTNLVCQNFQPIILHGETLTHHPKVFRICIMYFYFQNVFIHFSLFFYFNTTASDVCKSLRVQLQNNAWEAQTEKEGTYELASKVNGQPSWISEYAGIWYVPETTRWFSVTRFDYNRAQKSHDLLKIQGLSLVEILFFNKILYKICSSV